MKVNVSLLTTRTDKWSPALQIRTVLISIQALLSSPNPDDPLANDVAAIWKENQAQAIATGNRLASSGPIFCFAVLSNLFNTSAKEWTQKHAKADT